MNEIPIVVAFDQAYIVPACVMLTSLFESAGTATVYRVHIFANEATRKAADDSVARTLRGYPRHAIEWLDPGQRFASSKTRKHLTVPNYYRFLMPDFLKEYDRALWIDVDVVVKKDLSALASSDLEGNCLGAVRIGLSSASVKDVPSGAYFNAGVLLLNLALWRRERITDRIARLVEENDFSCPTQDPLNLVAFGRTLYLPVEYNVLSFGSMKAKNREDYLAFHGRDDFGVLVGDAAVVHFVGGIKPWNDRRHPLREEWLRYFRISAVRDERLDYAGRPSVFRKWTVKLLSAFVPGKTKRRAFRDKYLTP